MANHRSAIKRHKQSVKRNIRNVKYKSEIKTAVKSVRSSVTEGNKEEAQKNLLFAIKLYDKSVSKGVYHRSTASRRISRLSLAVNTVN